MFGGLFIFAEVVLARLKKKELFGEYGPNKDFYYIIDHSSPIEEINRVIPTPPTEGA